MTCTPADKVNCFCQTVLPDTATRRSSWRLPDSLLQEVLRASGQQLPDSEGLAENLEQIRRRGLARAEGDFMDGMSAFAAPVFSDRGRLVAVMTLLGYRGGFDSRWNGPLAQALKAAAQRTSQALGFRG